MVHAIDFLEVCPIVMDQELHIYFMDWVTKFTWQGTILTKKKNIVTPQHLRNLRTFYPRVPDGGYHFSWMGNVDRVLRKMTSIVEGKEFAVKSNGKLTDENVIKELLKNGKLFWFADNDERSQLLPCDEKKIKLPYLEQFLVKYPQFLRVNALNLK